jgi:NTP pyrophosphatase (non-canonical NTP hydrolase)
METSNNLDNMNPTFLPVSDVMSESLNNLCGVVNDWATKKGWNEGEDSLAHKCEQIALMHSELSECLEALRHKGVCPHCKEPQGDVHSKTGPQQWHCGLTNNYFNYWDQLPDDKVPALTGEAAELADVLIRIFHYCGKRGIDLGRAVQLKHQYNTTRPYRHGKRN